MNSPSHRLLVCEEQGVLQGYVLINFASHYETPASGFESVGELTNII
ncbi:hypothetical protein [Pseudoalteromonas byunsanensis]